MDSIDGTDHYEKTTQSSPPALLTIVLDTNPHAWNLLSSTLSLYTAVANLLVFVNAHLACNSANKVAIIASHCQRTQWLYPTPRDLQDARAASNPAMDVAPTTLTDANKYRPFRVVESEVLANLQHLLRTTTVAELQSTNTTLISGALTMALNYINKSTIATASTSAVNQSSLAANAPTASNPFSTASSTAQTTLNPRILLLSLSTSLSVQYIPLMNLIFAAQRLHLPIDVLALAGDTTFLQQAADATGGIYLAPSTPQGLLQYLMLAFLHDQSARRHLVLPRGDGVDFRAACFCHRRIVDIGFVCSICLSIFCEVLPDGVCLTCGTQLELGDYGSVPVLVGRKRKKKKGKGLGGVDSVAEGTPVGTPRPS